MPDQKPERTSPPSRLLLVPIALLIPERVDAGNC